MIRVYFDYPTAKDEGVKIHWNPSCDAYRGMNRSPARNIHVGPETFSQEVQPFLVKKHKFGGGKEWDSMWVEVDFDNETFERAVAAYLKQLLGKRYTPFAAAALRDCKWCGE